MTDVHVNIYCYRFAGERSATDPRKEVNAIGEGRRLSVFAKFCEEVTRVNAPVHRKNETTTSTTSAFPEWDKDFSKELFERPQSSSAAAAPSFCADARLLYSSVVQKDASCVTSTASQAFLPEKRSFR